MKASTKNRLGGTFRKMRGTVKVAIGRTVNRRRIALTGHVDKTAGLIQVKFGSVQRILGL